MSVEPSSTRCELGSLGAEIAAVIADEAFDALDAPVKGLAGPESPGVPFAQVLDEEFMLDPMRIATGIRELADYERRARLS